MITPQELEEARRLLATGLSLRTVARKLGRDRKTLRKALGGSPPHPKPPDKLGPFKEIASQLYRDHGLFAPRILREIREKGYPGSLTLLKDFLRTLGPRQESRRVFRRFETKPGVEMQCDWSPYRLRIGGEERLAHCLSLVLCCCRRLWIGFFRNERLPTLLWAHVEAFAYHGGVCQRIVYDNQTAVSLGRVERENLWNPTFLEFAKFYGFRPYTHKVGHKERSGKVERPFWYLETDFLKGKTFASWDDLNAQARHWLDTIANVRPHGTTRRPIHEAYAEEKPFLIALPSSPFPTDRREMRKVQKDGTILVEGSFYPVPPKLVGQSVTVSISPTRVSVLDAAGRVVVTHPVPDRPTRLPTDWGPPAPPSEAPSRTALEAAFLARFPQARAFLDGLKRRMTTLTPIHLRTIDRLADLYGDAGMRAALERATVFRNFNSGALERILARAHPNVIPEPPIAPLFPRPESLAALDDVDSGSPQDYTLDSEKPTEGLPDGT
jgi:transposase